jgi:hypothetical protein
MIDSAAVGRAYRLLGLQPGVSPLAARRRYRELVGQWHPDRHPRDAAAQAEATRRTQEINEAYRTIRDAARHHEVPLRRARPVESTPAAPSFDLYRETMADRAVAAIVGVGLGLFIDFALLADSAIVWVIVPAACGLFGAAVGWKAIEAIIRLIWWLV